MSGVLAEGTLYIDRQVSGVSTGRVKWPGVAKLEIKPNSELIEQTSKDKGKYGQITGAVAINKPAELSLQISDITADALAMALQGTSATLTQGSGTVTAEAIIAKKGMFVDLSKRNVKSAGFTLTNTGATVTYVLGTDYEVNYAMGWVEILTAGAITDGQALKANFTYGATAGNKIQGGTLAQIKGKVELDGTNLVDGTPLVVTIWEATLTADGPVDFMSDKMVELSMKGKMSTPTGKSSAFETEIGMIYS
jgi:hypothetical protein